MRRVGHIRFVFYVTRLFLRDFLIVEIATLTLMAIGILKPYAFPIWSEALFFLTLAISTAEFLWFRMWCKYERD
jgi:hypothetical protein